MIEDFHGASWAIVDETFPPPQALAQALAKIGAREWADEKRVAPDWEDALERAGLQAEAGMASRVTLILDATEERLPSGVRIGWYLTAAVTPTARYGVYWNVGILTAPSCTIQTAHAAMRDYLLEMLRIAGRAPPR